MPQTPHCLTLVGLSLLIIYPPLRYSWTQRFFKDPARRAPRGVREPRNGNSSGQVIDEFRLTCSLGIQCNESIMINCCARFPAPSEHSFRNPRTVICLDGTPFSNRAAPRKRQTHLRRHTFLHAANSTAHHHKHTDNTLNIFRILKHLTNQAKSV
jgi:hypothetical protein